MIVLILILIIVILVSVYQYYPKQIMPRGVYIEIKTPNFEKYRNDCIHPCIRHIEEGFLGYHWWMVQSPYYENNSKVENPILYFSKDVDHPTQWEAVGVVCETPETGYNSDPNLYYESGTLWIFWRECDSPMCKEINVSKATVGVSTTDGVTFSEKKVYLTESSLTEDHEQCPILIKKDGAYYFYAVSYRYSPVRENIGISIWVGNSLIEPKFRIKETSKIKKIYTCDQYKQFNIGGKRFFVPKPLKHDVWHIDLLEYNGKLYMFSVAEWGDNIMLSVSDDYTTFRNFQPPLINKHYSKQYALYKPTGFVKDNNLYVYYTVKGQLDRKANELYYSFCNVDKGLKGLMN